MLSPAYEFYPLKTTANGLQNKAGSSLLKSFWSKYLLKYSLNISKYSLIACFNKFFSLNF